MAETVNYEVSKLTRHRVQPHGQVTRLSVAVVLDDNRPAASGEQGGPGQAAPRTPEEIQKIHDLVAAAVGLDTMRGDQLTVENIAFEEAPIEETPEVPIWKRYEPQAFETGRILGIVLIGLFAVFGVIRPMVRSAAGVQATAPRQAAAAPVQARTVQDLESEIDAQLQAGAAATPPRKLPVLTKRAAALTEREPENAARLLRAWLTEEER
jgi:flagellar M-ring protein FliF